MMHTAAVHKDGGAHSETTINPACRKKTAANDIDISDAEEISGLF